MNSTQLLLGNNFVVEEIIHSCVADENSLGFERERDARRKFVINPNSGAIHRLLSRHARTENNKFSLNSNSAHARAFATPNLRQARNKEDVLQRHIIY